MVRGSRAGVEGEGREGGWGLGGIVEGREDGVRRRRWRYEWGEGRERVWCVVAFEGGLDVLRFLAGGRVVGGIFLFSFFFFLFFSFRLRSAFG